MRKSLAEPATHIPSFHGVFAIHYPLPTSSLCLNVLHPLLRKNRSPACELW